MASATLWRDRAWFKLLRSFHSNARESSETGVPGVRLVQKRVKKGGRIYVVPCVIAEVLPLALVCALPLVLLIFRLEQD